MPSRSGCSSSDEVHSPLSWGWRHPVILIDPDTLGQPEDAEAILAHEVAHIARRDWPVLMLSRLAATLFWFNPLVWLLEREVVQQAEEAADCEAAERVEPARYAETLLSWAQANAHGPGQQHRAVGQCARPAGQGDPRPTAARASCRIGLDRVAMLICLGHRRAGRCDAARRRPAAGSAGCAAGPRGSARAGRSRGVRRARRSGRARGAARARRHRGGWSEGGGPRPRPDHRRNRPGHDHCAPADSDDRGDGRHRRGRARKGPPRSPGPDSPDAPSRP